MYIVISRFFDKTDNQKLYLPGNQYKSKDKERLKKLVENGFIEKKEEEKDEQKAL